MFESEAWDGVLSRLIRRHRRTTARQLRRLLSFARCEQSGADRDAHEVRLVDVPAEQFLTTPSGTILQAANTDHRGAPAVPPDVEGDPAH